MEEKDGRTDRVGRDLGFGQDPPPELEGRLSDCQVRHRTEAGGGEDEGLEELPGRAYWADENSM
jgi:hypothetical protein